MRIGARGSDLAQVQARMIEAMLNQAGIATTMVVISTHGDRVLDVPLSQLGTQGVFTKEIEDALLGNQIDLAVHSFKDVASIQPDGLEIVAVTEREDSADLLIIAPEKFLDNGEFLPVSPNSVVGTSAVRRSSQIKAIRPDLEVRDLRGNVPTRLEKLYQGKYDAIFLASAGVNRLRIDMPGYRVIRLDPSKFVPSPGQGALAIEMRSDDPFVSRVRECLHHEPTNQATSIERALLKRFGGGCSLPLGASVQVQDGNWTLRAFWGGGSNPRWTTQTGVHGVELVENAFNALSASE